MKKVITVKQVAIEKFDNVARCMTEINAYKIIKLQNTISWKIGEHLSIEEIKDIIENKIAEVIIHSYNPMT